MGGVAKKNAGRRPAGKALRAPRVPQSLVRKRGATQTGRAATEIALQSDSPAAVNDPAVEAFPIVGIGASAGGLEAFTELLSHLPVDTGMAFVLIQHLDPKHESHLTELLSKASAMPVTELKGDTRAEANHVYVIPPRCNLGISSGVLHTPPRSNGGRNMPIDSFLCTLAGDRGRQAYGVVLSGTGSDGTLGIQAIKAQGGITFAQEKRSAKFDAMPGSAIAAGGVDFVLTPAGIARQLVTIARGSNVAREASKPIEPPDAAEVELSKVFRLLRNATGVDFTRYKFSTIKRRIRRRMALRGFERLEDYIQDLEQNHGEANALCEDFFITVTAFFREPAVFQELTKGIFPALIENRMRDDPIRIWVPGCATGEEAYSIAMSLTEFLDDAAVPVPFQIFATDISETAVEKARAGVYTQAAVRPIPPARLARFFTKSEHGYQIAKSIRDVCVFARHDLALDPPFSKLDLISCCNVLIYLGAALQRKVLSMLHYALKPAGFLVLGPSESIGTLSDLFDQVEKKHKIYFPLPAAGAPAPELGEGLRAKSRLGRSGPTAGARVRPDVQTEADRLLLAEYAPAGVIIDDAMNIVQVRGHTGPYLELSPGEPSHNLLRMVREGLIASVSKAIQAAKRTNATVKEDGLRVVGGGQFIEVEIKVIPFRESSASQERYFLILFEDAASAARPKQGSAKPAAAARRVPGDGEATRLRLELAATKEYLQSIIEEKESALEELRSASEEAQAGNEELETAQEELESANEELNTLNEELKSSNTELSQVNRDLTNLLESINIPLVMVGKDLRIRRFTRAIEPMLNLIASDAGRLITDLQPHIELPDLRRLLLDAMEGGDREPRDVRDAHGNWYSLRILPSAGVNGKIDGAVVMLIDIDAAKRGLDFAEAIVETVREPLVILNHNLRVVSANKAFYETFQVTPQETEDRLIYDLGEGQWDIPKLRELLDNILPARSTFRDFEVVHEFKRVGRKVMLLNAREVFDANAQARTILLAIEDTTDRKRAEDALKATNAELQNFAYALTHDLQEPVRMVVNFTQLLARQHEGKLGQEADKFIGYSVEGAIRIEALLKALLTYWETTEQGQDIFGAVDCNDVLARTLVNLRAVTAQSGAIVTSEPLPTVVGEQVMLMQVFQNLIANSLKYRSGATPRIHIAARRDKEQWLFSVEDNGVGIDPQDAERVFGMFKRLHGPDIPGAGLGLALCRKVIQRHGGRIWVESEAGQGATFNFTIPASNGTTSRILDNRGGVAQ
jgi:two-component system, chemotaxis family, CheB/CheR fusion protein